ncbi:MAG: hypothetical protein LC637_11000 [Xanthomonadaceae bacterium]|nr:hypothetical protein [Xanthomonadaceae bacterium]
MSMTTQISATVSSETKTLLDQFSRRRGVKKGFLIETALRHHLTALAELPESAMVPPVVRVSPAAMKRIADLIETPPKSKALDELMREG